LYSDYSRAKSNVRQGPGKNVQIIRVYTRLRQFLLNNLNNEEIRNKIESIEKNLIKKDEEIQTIFKILKELLVQEPAPAREPIGFKIPKK
jgi:uncharacterized membrane protein